MATYKAEFLSKHYKRRLRPREAYSMGPIMFHARLGSLAPRLASFLANRKLLKRLGGIAPARQAPAFASEQHRVPLRGPREVDAAEDAVGRGRPAGPVPGEL